VFERRKRFDEHLFEPPRPPFRDTRFEQMFEVTRLAGLRLTHADRQI
jgi:hypothetical protein